MGNRQNKKKIVYSESLSNKGHSSSRNCEKMLNTRFYGLPNTTHVFLGILGENYTIYGISTEILHTGPQAPSSQFLIDDFYNGCACDHQYLQSVSVLPTTHSLPLRS